MNTLKLDFPKHPTTSWIIRTKNEEKWIGKVLEALLMQDRLDFEILIVDSGSTDHTLEITEKYPIRKIIKISPAEFQYAYALNLGIQESWGKYMGIISAHSLPSSRKWYSEAFKNFEDPKVAAVGGNYTSLPDGDYIEKLGDMIYHINQINEGNLFSGFQKDYAFTDFTNTNSMIRKDLWEKYPFDERLQESEDRDWALEMLARGHKVVYDPVFNVYHSHGGLGRPTIYERMELWNSINKGVNSKTRPSKSYSRLNV